MSFVDTGIYLARMLAECQTQPAEDQLRTHLQVMLNKAQEIKAERDTLRTQLAEANDALAKKNARIAEYAERHLKDSELLDEARELLEEVRTLECRGVDMGHVDAWLEACSTQR